MHVMDMVVKRFPFPWCEQGFSTSVVSQTLQLAETQDSVDLNATILQPVHL